MSESQPAARGPLSPKGLGLSGGYSTFGGGALSSYHSLGASHHARTQRRRTRPFFASSSMVGPAWVPEHVTSRLWGMSLAAVKLNFVCVCEGHTQSLPRRSRRTPSSGHFRGATALRTLSHRGHFQGTLDLILRRVLGLSEMGRGLPPFTVAWTSRGLL
jgi:hypothetical protein